MPTACSVTALGPLPRHTQEVCDTHAALAVAVIVREVSPEPCKELLETSRNHIKVAGAQVISSDISASTL